MDGDDLSNAPLLPQSENRLLNESKTVAEEGVSPAEPAEIAMEGHRGAAENTASAPKPKAKPKRK